MLTKEYHTEKDCIFSAGQYHFEMIILPYIKERMSNTKFIVFTEVDLQESLNILLDKINLKEDDKEKIKEINWKKNDVLKQKQLEKYIYKDMDICVFIYGRTKYINSINSKLKYENNKKINIIDCYDIQEEIINIKELSKKYKNILNTKSINEKGLAKK